MLLGVFPTSSAASSRVSRSSDRGAPRTGLLAKAGQRDPDFLLNVPSRGKGGGEMHRVFHAPAPPRDVLMTKPRIAMVSLVVLAVALASVAYTSIPGQHQASAQAVSEITAVVIDSGVNSTVTQTAGVAVAYSSCSGSTDAYGNMTLTVSPCVSYGFPSAHLKNATLDSRAVLAFIKTAYEYHIVYFGHSKANSNVMYAVLNVTGSQVVTGNWTSGYSVSYVGDKLLNVTVLQVVASHYEVTHVSAYALPD